MIFMPKLMHDLGLTPSYALGRRYIRSGGVAIDGKPVNSSYVEDDAVKDNSVISVGKSRKVIVHIVPREGE